MATNGTPVGTLAKLGDALTAFVEAFSDAATAKDVGQRLNCDEVDALAELLHVAGDSTSAARWLVAHGRGDHGPDDWHRNITEAEAAELLNERVEN